MRLAFALLLLFRFVSQNEIRKFQIAIVHSRHRVMEHYLSCASWVSAKKFMIDPHAKLVIIARVGD